jgi:hypothetical protein
MQPKCLLPGAPARRPNHRGQSRAPSFFPRNTQVVFSGQRNPSPRTFQNNSQTLGCGRCSSSKTCPISSRAQTARFEITSSGLAIRSESSPKYMPLKAGQCAKIEPSTGKDADLMAYEPTTTDVEFKALRGALSTLRSKLPRKQRACFGASQPRSSSRATSRYRGLLVRLEKAVQKGP